MSEALTPATRSALIAIAKALKGIQTMIQDLLKEK
jgi:hypothetical protein